MKLLSGHLLPSPAPTNHASSLCALPDGGLLAVWFGGHHESADDVEIYAARCENGVWRSPAQLSVPSGEACWNPVLWTDPMSGEITLWFKRGRKIAHWRTFVRRSSDSGRTWSAEEEAVPGDTSGGRGPVKNKPLLLRDGTLIAGASHESEDGRIWRAFFDLSADGGHTWQRTPYLETDRPVRLIQPTLWEDVDGVHTLLRSDSGFLWRADSPDSGRTWSKARPTAVPNNNSGVDCVFLPESGTLVLACNPVGQDWGARSPLSLLISRDGGRSWKRGLDPERGEGEFSYPAVVAADGALYVSYTWNRRGIRVRKVEA